VSTRTHRTRRRGQALVEAALVIPLLLLLALGVVGIGRLVQARMALDAITREAVRAAVLSPMPRQGEDDDDAWRDARSAGEARAVTVARGYGLDPEVSLTRDRRFMPGEWVHGQAEVRVNVINLPFQSREYDDNPRGPMVQLTSSHWERIDPYRSRLP
jgi:hypothetical protein